MKKHLPIGVALTLGALSQAGHAYNYITCSGNPMDFGSGYMTFNYANNLSTLQKSRISTAFSRLTAFADSNINTVDNGDSSFSGNNGQNEIYINTNVGTADCSYWFNTTTCVVSEADIRFGDETWVTGDDSQHAPFTSLATGRSITGAAVHEGGHCVGLAHSNDLYNIMGEEWDHVTRNGVNTWYGPGEDASDGLIDLHGKSSSNAYPDVGASIFRYDGPDGAYSEHRFGVIRNGSGSTLPVVGSFEGQPVYEIVAGETVDLELTFENNGWNNTETPNTGYYLSTNSFISGGDTLLRTGNLTLGRNAPYETDVSVTIPLDTAPGNYFLGVIVDHDNQIIEYTNSNNVAYYPVSIVEPPPDLTVPFSGVLPNFLRPTETFSALSIVRNEGDGPSTATTVRYLRSTNSTISLSDTQIGTDAIGALAAGGQQSSNAPATAPASNGTWWVGACVDSVPGEVNAFNQCSTGTQITVSLPPPDVSTDSVGSVTNNLASINATVNANGGATTLYFDYGTDNQFQNTFVYGSVASGLNPIGVNGLLTDLVCNTTYQVRTRASNAAGTTFGNTLQFTTDVCPGC